MAQYAPVKGDDENNQFDDGTSQKPTPASTPTPDPKPEPTPTPDPKPEVPETPAGRTLANGKAITESNVTAILNQLKSRYPNSSDFSKGYAGLGSGRTPAKNCIAQIVSPYPTILGVRCSTTIGCGGWAAFVADEIWGQTGVTWKKTTLENVRPGDLLIIKDNNGSLEHVSIYVGRIDGQPVTTRIATTDAVNGKNGYHSGWNKLVTLNLPLDIYTAYPN